MTASSVNRLVPALQKCACSMCQGPALTSVLLSTLCWHVTTMQVQVEQTFLHNPTNITPAQSAGPAVGVKKTALTTEPGFLRHTDNHLACHPDIFAVPCASTYKRRKFYQAPNGRIDTVILGFHNETDASHIFLPSEKEIVSRLTKREVLKFITLFLSHWPSIFFHAFI